MHARTHPLHRSERERETEIEGEIEREKQREEEREGERKREGEKEGGTEREHAHNLSIPHSVSQSVSMRDYYINDHKRLC